MGFLVGIVLLAVGRGNGTSRAEPIFFFFLQIVHLSTLINIKRGGLIGLNYFVTTFYFFHFLEMVLY